VVKEIVDKIRNAEVKAEKLVKDAEAKAEQDVAQFARERTKQLEKIKAENDEIRRRALDEAEEKARQEEARILDEAQINMNGLRAAAEKKKEEAILLTIRKILEQ